MEPNQNQQNPEMNDENELTEETEPVYEVDYRDPNNYQIIVALKCIGAGNKYQVFDNIPPITAEPNYVKGDPWAAIRPLDGDTGVPDSYDVQIFHLIRAASSLYARKFGDLELANHVADQILNALYGYQEEPASEEADIQNQNSEF